MNTLALTRLRARVSWLEAKRGTDMFVFLSVLLVVLGIGAAIGLVLLMRFLVPAHPEIARTIVLGTFAAVGTFQLVAAFKTSLTRLFLSSEVELYLIAPVRHIELWLSKIVEIVAASPISLGALLLFTGAYTSVRAPAVLPLALAVALLTPVAAAIAGTIAAMTIARVVPPKRLEAMLSLAGLALGMALASLGPLLGWLGDRGRSDPFADSAAAGLDALQWYPPVWPGTALTALLDLRWATGLGATVFSLLAVAVLFVVGHRVFLSTFYETWSRVTEVQPRRPRSTILERLAPPLPQAMRAIVLKEWQIVGRDLKRVTAMLAPLAFIGYLVVHELTSGDAIPGIAVGIALPVLLGGIGQQAMLGEGRNITLALSTPISPAEFLWAKVAAWAVPVVTLCVVLVAVLGMIRGQNPLLTAGIALAATWLAVGVLTINVALAAMLVRFAADSDEKPDPASGFASIVVSLIFMAGHAPVGVWLMTRSQSAGSLAHPLVGVLTLLPVAAVVTGIWWLMGRAIRRLENLDAP